MKRSPQSYASFLKDLKKELPALKAWDALDLKTATPAQICHLHEAATLEVGYLTAEYFNVPAHGTMNDSPDAVKVRSFMKSLIAQSYHKAGLADTIDAARELYDTIVDYMKMKHKMVQSQALGF